MTLTIAGYIIHTDDLIHGTGDTAERAWANAVANLSAAGIVLLDDNEDAPDCGPSWMRFSSLRTAPATAELLNDVRNRGGACGWDNVGAITCTPREFYDHQDIPPRSHTIVHPLANILRLEITHGAACVSEEDRNRAEHAAYASISAAGTTVAAAYAEFQRQWAEHDDYALMTGLALAWVNAQKAADLALTEGWHNTEGAACTIHA